MSKEHLAIINLLQLNVLGEFLPSSLNRDFAIFSRFKLKHRSTEDNGAFVGKFFCCPLFSNFP
jgi:hypothetical protein